MHNRAKQQSEMPARSGITTAGYKPAGYLLVCIILVLANAQLVAAETGRINRTPPENSGVINRTPLITPEPEPSSLERIKNSISDLVRSINEIIDTPNDAITEVIPAEKPAELDTPSLPVLAEPLPDTLENESEHIQTTLSADNTGKTTAVSTVSTTVEQAAEQTASSSKTESVYLKHDINGNRLQADDNEWACVEDTHNGLVWEVKSSNGDIRDRNNSYTWFNPSDKNLQGIADGGRCVGDTDCDTHAYITAINQQKLCGYSDWRLPTREEMMSLVDFNQDGVTAKINLKYFPQALPSWYWTASSNESQPQYAWYVLFRNGVSLNDLKQRPKHIRLVRGNRNV